ncbi:hypothetical protein [Streptomyces sp. CA-106110]|uniref:hypothetical protein n=1 Tax=Streptomyces sp. CA-106110 TaxID=3240044 RepID=UPI003D93C4A6
MGTRVAEIGAAFGMDTIAWSQNLKPEDARAKGVAYVSRDELFSALRAWMWVSRSGFGVVRGVGQG